MTLHYTTLSNTTLMHQSTQAPHHHCLPSVIFSVQHFLNAIKVARNCEACPCVCPPLQYHMQLRLKFNRTEGKRSQENQFETAVQQDALEESFEWTRQGHIRYLIIRSQGMGNHCCSGAIQTITRCNA